MSIEDTLNNLMENKDESLEDELLEAVKKKMKEEDKDDKKGGDVKVDPVAAAADDEEEEQEEPEVKNDNPIDPDYSDEKEEEEEEEEKKEQEMKEASDVYADDEKHSGAVTFNSKKEAEEKIRNLKSEDGNFHVKASGDKFVVTHSYYNNKKIANMINKQQMKEASCDDEKKMSVKESVTELLGGEELSEDFKLKAATIFEAAVNNKFYELKESLEADYSAKEKALTEEFEAKTKTLEEETAKQLEEAVAEFEKTLSDKIDGYFDIWSEQWISDNELALESGVKAELVESFIDGMKNVFEEHYVDIPETKIDIVQEMETKIEQLEKSLSESVEMFREVKQRADTVTREKIIEESAKSMTDLDASRFKRLVEDIEFDTEKTFAKKVSIIKESFFRVKDENKQDEKSQTVDTKALLEEKVIPTENDPMSAYIKALKGSKA